MFISNPGHVGLQAQTMPRIRPIDAVRREKGAVDVEVKATQHVLAVNDLERTEQYFLGELGFSLRFRVEGWSFVSLGSFFT